MSEYQLHLKWALLLIGTLLAWQVVERLVGWHSTYLEFHYTFSFINLVIMAIIYYLAFSELLQQSDRQVSPKALIRINGVVLTLVVCLLIPAGLWILYNFVSPNLMSDEVAYKVAITGLNPAAAEEAINSKMLLTKLPFIAGLYGIVLTIAFSKLLSSNELST